MSGGFFKYRCKYFYSHDCPNWVFVNYAPCADCCAAGRDDPDDVYDLPLHRTPLDIAVPVLHDGVLHYAHQRLAVHAVPGAAFVTWVPGSPLQGGGRGSGDGRDDSLLKLTTATTTTTTPMPPSPPPPPPAATHMVMHHPSHQPYYYNDDADDDDDDAGHGDHPPPHDEVHGHPLHAHGPQPLFAVHEEELLAAQQQPRRQQYIQQQLSLQQQLQQQQQQQQQQPLPLPPPLHGYDDHHGMPPPPPAADYYDQQPYSNLRY